MFSAYVSPLGRDLVDKRLYLRERWTSEIGRCSVAGVPEERRGYRSKTELALDMPERAWERRDVFGMSPPFRDGLEAKGMPNVKDAPRAPRCGRWRRLGRTGLPGPGTTTPSWWMDSTGRRRTIVVNCRRMPVGR